jgi:hypothetical protein
VYLDSFLGFLESFLVSFLRVSKSFRVVYRKILELFLWRTFVGIIASV